MKIKLIAVLAGLGLAASACSSNRPASDTSSASPSGNLPVEVAIVNYEVLASTSNRLLVGLILSDNRLVAYGTVQMRFQALDASGQPTGLSPSSSAPTTARREDGRTARPLPRRARPGGNGP